MERVPIGWEGKRASFRNCNSFARQELTLRRERERERVPLPPPREWKELEGFFEGNPLLDWPSFCSRPLCSKGKLRRLVYLLGLIFKKSVKTNFILDLRSKF